MQAKSKRTGLLLALGIAIAAPSLAAAADPVMAPVDLPSAQSAKGSTWYVRGELGAAWIAEDRGYWWGPGGPPDDPRITFNLDTDTAWIGAVALGMEFMDGVRADFSLGYVGESDVDADWISASDGSPGPHADIDASVSAFTGMLNLFVEPLAMAGNNGPFQPFVTGGIGFARVEMDEWTRTRAGALQPVRRWSGNEEVNFAWAIGAGIAADIGTVLNRSAYLDLTYRYSDLGNVSGGTAPTFPGPPPSNSPTEPFNFDYRTHAVTIGFRMPLGPQ